uniref:Uncharacterized protein n=1 Tax=Manihot esculenta TaxID=3983 RepID=A0A2C9U9A5_MANES
MGYAWLPVCHKLEFNPISGLAVAGGVRGAKHTLSLFSLVSCFSLISLMISFCSLTSYLLCSWYSYG